MAVLLSECGKWYDMEIQKPIIGRWFIGTPANPYRSDIMPYIAYQMHGRTPLIEIGKWMYIPSE